MSLMLVLHIIFLIIWSASLLYFPQLFANQAFAKDIKNQTDIVLMQYRLYAHVMTPSALLTIAAGIWLIFERGFHGGWLPVKLVLVLFMVIFHAYCGKLMDGLIRHHVQQRVVYYQILLLIPLLLITNVIMLVVSKPF
ncbi:CopD family protein [Nitrosococcus wardiae]|uniref:Protoporphyrinogen IX oxidase n=1 Tax=Nitrosococcus wardiae TaxID=1814290 RepID=A0A4P7C420_9GAMM|nr:CopD family protein [Nitrosococcus wardiae]QBQ55716.1 CopD family protein [Nitrosococcus wardiae]